jgi:pSer/pThr/pTyr-binding forkhead associated (FHA) protein
MTKGPQSGREFRLNPDETTLGRADGNDIILDDPTVSRYHAKVRQEEGDFYLYDMGATNPTLVNGQRITRHPLREGDKVEIGEMLFVFKRVE